jgi:hypothetical protein
MKRLSGVVIALALVLPAAAYGAENEHEDVIYLKDGSVIRGIIIERVPGETYKIEIAGGSVLVVDAREVERIIREEKKVAGGPVEPAAGKQQQNRRWFVSVQPAAGIIAGGEAEPFYGAEFTVGNRIKETYSAGLGFGYERLDSLNIIPVYTHNRLNFVKSQGTVVYPYFDVGYGFIIDD